jgi:flagellar protein FliL
MSTATATDAAVPKKGKKKLIIIAAVVVLALGVAGGGAAVVLKKRANAEAEAEDGDAERAPAHAAAKHDPKAVPTFVPLDPFTVNLADRDAERYAQVGMTLELADAHVVDQIKAYLPAIRNNILMALADKTAAELLDRDGKSKLAEQVRRETARAMGYDVSEPEGRGADGKARKKKVKLDVEMPVTAVHFSNFIIQ